MYLKKAAKFFSFEAKAIARLKSAIDEKNEKSVKKRLKSMENKSATVYYELVQHARAAADQEEILDFIVEQCLSSSRESDAETLLHVAVRNGDGALCRSLLRKQIDVLACNKDRETALHLAFKLKQYSLLRDLLAYLKSANIHCNYADKSGLSIFHMICSHGAASHVQAFLQSKITADNGKASLLKASDSQSNSGSRRGHTALHFAAKRYRHEVVKILLEHGAEKDIVTADKDTALSLACFCDLKYVVEFLESDSGLHEADCARAFEHLMADRVETVRVLLKHDDSSDGVVRSLQRVTDKSSSSASSSLLLKLRGDRATFDRIVKQTRRKIVKLLLNCNEDASTEVKGLYLLATKYAAWRFGNSIMFCAILREDGSLDDMNATYGCNNETLLHVAAHHQNFRFIRDLLYTSRVVEDWEKMLNVDARDDRGDTVLHHLVNIAIKARASLAHFDVRHFTGCLAALLDHGADITLSNERGESALSIVCDHLQRTDDAALLKMANSYAQYANAELQVRLPHWYYPLSDIPIFVIWREIVKLSLAGCCGQELGNRTIARFADKLLRNRTYVKIYENFQRSCSEDLAKIKQIRLNNCFCLYDLLAKDVDDIAALAKNAKLKELLKSVVAEVKCPESQVSVPIYEKMLKARFVRDAAKRVLLREAAKSLKSIVQMDIPDEYYYSIMYYLNDQALRNVYEASRNIRT